MPKFNWHSKVRLFGPPKLQCLKIQSWTLHRITELVYYEQAEDLYANLYSSESFTFQEVTFWEHFVSFKKTSARSEKFHVMQY